MPPSPEEIPPLVGKGNQMDKLNDENVPEGYTVVYTPYITLKNGKRLYASSYGRKVWRLVIRNKK
jgi:hypothetical protein